MSDEPEILAESLRAEAVNAAATHEEAQAKARSADMHSVVTAAIREVLSDPDGSPLLIKRIPFICTDMAAVKKDLGTISDTIQTMANNALWTNRIAVGIAGLLSLVGLPLLGWMLVTIIKSSTAIAVLNHATTIAK